MRRKSHHMLGKYLAEHYLSDASPRYIYAFVLGCTQPDLNPVTYLKGSTRFRWFRGHNYPNSRNAMNNFSHRLENKEKFTVWDYYTIGKLIHYTADAFTYAHNTSFPNQLNFHRIYEAQLQNYFLAYLSSAEKPSTQFCGGIMDTVSKLHLEYSKKTSNIHYDTVYCLNACCNILSILFPTTEKSNVSNPDYIQRGIYSCHCSDTPISDFTPL